MTFLRALVLVPVCMLPLALCQCRCVNACVRFLQEHSAKGHNSALDGDLPGRAQTVEEFVAANVHRGIAPDVLRSRFRVADLNRDGRLTAEEMRRHRVIAAENKKRRQG